MKHTYLVVPILLVLVLSISAWDGKQESKVRKIFWNVNKRQFVGNEVVIENGAVIGKQDRTAAGTDYWAFQGIPYAEPPVGDLRFEPPVPLENYWTTPWNATYERSICYQTVVLAQAEQEGTEDCLYLNVYRPKALQSESNLLPVMVWIHGGGFLTGSGNYASSGPNYFLDKGILVVTINYRLGVFGWLSSGDDVVPGNMGLKDLVQGLKWVRANIKEFGGNPNHVTIMGESAGAALVSYLVQSPLAKGLYNAAIIQSGNTLSPWAISRKARENMLLLAKLHGVWTDNSKLIIKTLKNANADHLFSNSVITMELLLITDPLNGFIYAPVAENVSPTAAFMGMAYEQLVECNVNDVPILIGCNSAELVSNEDVAGLVKSLAGITTIIPATLVPKDMNVEKKSNANIVGQIIKQHYTNGSLAVTNDDFLRYLSDDFFVRPTAKYVQLFSKCNNTYFYRFAYDGDRNNTGAGHAEELKYLFSTGILNSVDDRTVSEYLVGLWSNFMKFWDPTPTHSEFDITWTASSNANGLSYLDLDEELHFVKLADSPHYYDIFFWFKLYANFGSRPFDTY